MKLLHLNWMASAITCDVNDRRILEQAHYHLQSTDIADNCVGKLGRGAAGDAYFAQAHYLLTVLRIRIRRIHMFLGLLDWDPDPLVRGMDPDPDPASDPDPSIIKQR